MSRQRRRLALLALLAASGERGLSRDQLVGYLWPESAGDSGRHSLEQLLHSLRRALGEPIFSGTNPVSLNAAAITSDIGDFTNALSNEHLEEAVALYQGQFLQGFYLDDAAEFERWSTIERAGLANRYADALNSLASDAEKAGNHTAAVKWRRRLTEADPVSSRHALGLMRALVAAGDRTAALQHARIYEALVRQELESDADPSIAQYAANLRAGMEEPPKPVRTATVSAPPAPMPPTSVEPRRNVETLTQGEQAATVALPASLPARSSSAFWWIAATATLAAVSVAAIVSTKRPNVTSANNNRIVVVPFRITSADSSMKYLGEGAADLMAPMLTGEGGPAAVDARSTISTWNRITRGSGGSAEEARRVARELGAALALSGTIVESGGRLTITGNVISANGGDERSLTSVSGPVDSLENVLDRLVRQLLAGQSGVEKTSISAITSQSLPAIRAYLTGRAAYRRADENRAIESFARALDVDSTFALAALDLALATGNLLRQQLCQTSQNCRVVPVIPGLVSTPHNQDLFERAVRLAWENRGGLTRRDRPLLEALRGARYPRDSPASETFLSLGRAVRAAPDRPETHYLLGTLLMYQGAALGLSNSRGDAEAAFRTASRLDSTYLAPLAAMVDLAAFARDTAKLRASAKVYLASDTFGPTAEYVRWLVAAGTMDLAAQRVMHGRLRSLNRSTLDRIFGTSQMSGMGLDDADTVAALLIQNATDPLEKSVEYRRAGLLSLNRGRPAEGTRRLASMRELRADHRSPLNSLVDAGVFGGGDRAAGDSAAKVLARLSAHDTIGTVPERVRAVSATLSVLSMWYLAAGDTVRAAAAASWIGRHSEGQPRNRVLSVLPNMLVASRARRAEGKKLRALVDSVSLRGCCELPEFVMLVLARAYEASGDEARALDVIRRGIWYWPPRLLSIFLREEGRVSARLGQRTEAIRAYEHYLALRSKPESSRLAQRDSVRAELARLKLGR
ncbi:MAG: BTAD domain-containing putative transcriptional regulator [Gemmatimonadaceae bacterium]